MTPLDGYIVVSEHTVVQFNPSLKVLALHALASASSNLVVTNNTNLQALALCGLASDPLSTLELHGNGVNFTCASSRTAVQSACDLVNSVPHDCSAVLSIAHTALQATTLFEATDVSSDAQVRCVQDRGVCRADTRALSALDEQCSLLSASVCGQ